MCRHTTLPLPCWTLRTRKQPGICRRVHGMSTWALLPWRWRWLEWRPRAGGRMQCSLLLPSWLFDCYPSGLPRWAVLQHNWTLAQRAVSSVPCWRILRCRCVEPHFVCCRDVLEHHCKRRFGRLHRMSTGLRMRWIWQCAAPPVRCGLSFWCLCHQLYYLPRRLLL